MRAKDIMTSPVITVTGDTPLKDAAEILVTREISALPVVDGRGKLIGILSEADIVPLELTPDPRAQMIPVPARAVAHTVEEAMTRDVVALPEDAGISWIATLMLEKHIKRIPIVSGAFVVGIVSRRDLLRVLIRSDAQIRSDLQTLLDWEAAGIGAYRVEVANNVVTLAGPHDDISRKSAALLARTIPGVVEVTFTDVV